MVKSLRLFIREISEFREVREVSVLVILTIQLPKFLKFSKFLKFPLITLNHPFSVFSLFYSAQMRARLMIVFIAFCMVVSDAYS